MTCEATDATGNIRTASFVVTVAAPGTAPSISRIGVPSFTRATQLTVTATARIVVPNPVLVSSHIRADVIVAPGWLAR